MSWFNRNVRDVQWYDGGSFGVYGDFEQGERFPEFGFNFGVVWPGQPVAMYHREDNQEGFLVLSGECPADLSLPGGVAHIVVGAGDGPTFLIAVGERVGPGTTVYPVEPVAVKHRAGVEEDTNIPAEVDAPFADPEPTPFREEFLPRLEPTSA